MISHPNSSLGCHFIVSFVFRQCESRAGGLVFFVIVNVYQEFTVCQAQHSVFPLLIYLLHAVAFLTSFYEGEEEKTEAQEVEVTCLRTWTGK